MSVSPYVSFVSSGRNDGYTPSYGQRVSRSTAYLANQLERAGLDAEIIFVEWNPPSGRPLLIEQLQLPKTLKHVSIRAYVVAAKFHAAYVGAQERGLQAGEAANVGIRRARGRFVTSKASDTFFSQEVIAMIAQRNLQADTMYRIDRHDITINDDQIWNLDDDALSARLALLPSTPHAWIRQMPFWKLPDLHTNACGDFTLMTSAYWQYLRGHPRDDTVLALDIDSLVMHEAAALGVREQRWPDKCRVYKPLHDNVNSARIIYVWHPWQRLLNKFLSDKVSETAAHWARTLFDYPRRKVRGVDSLLGPSIERNLVRPASRWARGAKLVPTQPENWGLRDAALEPRTLCRASWDA